jgi:hypothetical protein
MLLQGQDPSKLGVFVVFYGLRINNCSLGIANLECSHIWPTFLPFMLLMLTMVVILISFFVPMVVMVGF